jgi:hypothetical protein
MAATYRLRRTAANTLPYSYISICTFQNLVFIPHPLSKKLAPVALEVALGAAWSKTGREVFQSFMAVL